MNYTEKTKPGMGDPYWYEWSVGEQQIINMLNEDYEWKKQAYENVYHKKLEYTFSADDIAGYRW